MQNTSPRFVLLSMVAALTVAFAACGDRSGQAATAEEAAPPYAVTATIKDLMQGLIDINADVVWLSVSSVHTEKGVQETKPRTDEDWAMTRHGAIALAESANLLMMPGRRVARPGEKSETPGVELEPEEMQTMIEQDRGEWNRRAQALHEAANAALAAIDARNPEKLFEVGEQIELACEGCHSHFWYPNEVIPPVELTIK